MQIPEEIRGVTEVWFHGRAEGVLLEVFIPTRKLLIRLSLVAGETVKVDVAGTLCEHQKYSLYTSNTLRGKYHNYIYI